MNSRKYSDSLIVYFSSISIDDLLRWPEISIYSDSGWDSSEPNVRLEEYNYNEGQLSNIPLDVHASVVNTDGQLRNILSDMELIDTDDQVRNTLSDVEPIDMEYLMESCSHASQFIAAFHG